MFGWLAEMSGLDKLFAVCAVIGTVLFMIRVVLMFVGGGDGETDLDADGGLDADADVDGGLDAHVDSDLAHAGEAGASDFSFKILSFQGLTAFFMMFGLVGLALSRSSGAAPLLAMAGALAAGFGMVWVISWLFVWFKRMQHTGTLNLRNAVGREGKVYLKIPAGEPGKVQVEVQGRLMVLEAVSEDKSEVPTDARVRIVNVVSGNVLVVTKAEG